MHKPGEGHIRGSSSKNPNNRVLRATSRNASCYFAGDALLSQGEGLGYQRLHAGRKGNPLILDDAVSRCTVLFRGLIAVVIFRDCADNGDGLSMQ